MDRYKNKYRNASARAQWWDYGWNAAYFITICTKNREHFFGEIKNGKMEWSPTGVIADILWHEIPNHCPFVELGDFVVMPNHIHGILILDKPNNIVGSVGSGHALTLPTDKTNPTKPTNPTEPTQQSGHALTLQSEPMDPPKKTEQTQPTEKTNPPEKTKQTLNTPTIGKNRFQNIGKNTISSIIGSYKSAVTKHANRLGLENGWQPRFHDHIIRNDPEYQRISDYIVNNPKNWKEDKFYIA